MQALAVEFGRAVCGEDARTRRLEWLVTNGIGGFAMGTVSGELTRRYHGLLVAALQPPLGRTLLAVQWLDSARYLGQTAQLTTGKRAGRAKNSPGRWLERFELAGTTPVWTYAIADARLEKRIWMQPGANTTYLRYTLLAASAPLQLSGSLLADDRDYHCATLEPLWAPAFGELDRAAETIARPAGADGLRLQLREGGTPFYVRASGGRLAASYRWEPGFELAIEQERGFEGREGHLAAVRHRVTLQPGESLTLVFSTEESTQPDGAAAWVARQAYEQALIERLPACPVEDAPVVARLALAADQFIVARPSEADPQGRSVIAGYPWFSDWGRDTMISLPGLALCTGRPEVARSILTTFSRHVSMGMLPNRFPDEGEQPEYNTVDATLWYFEAVRAYLAATGDRSLLEQLYPVLAEVIDWHLRGTRYSIHVDPADGLVYAGEAGVQLTWMDVKIGDWVVTPRTGKAVEINALWHNALCCMAEFAGQLGREAEPYVQAAQRVREGFTRFWNPQTGCCFDVIDGPNGSDPAVRPNQVIAAALHHSPMSADMMRGVLQAAARGLLTSHGLRSLANDQPGYRPYFAGDMKSRDSAYHQGTVWSWLIGPYVQAHLKVFNDRAAARRLLLPLLDHLRDEGLGTVSEVFDGEPPHRPGGCMAQAWGAAELLLSFMNTTNG